MPNGLQIRATIDSETAKALLLLNGGGAVALLAFLPTVIDREGYQPLARAVLYGVLMLMSGLVSAVIHNHLRRHCSLRYEKHDGRPPNGRLLGITLWAPGICCASQVFMGLSPTLFLAAGVNIVLTGLDLLGDVLRCPAIISISI